MAKVIINGAAGRMGQALARCSQRLDGITLVGAVERPGSDAIGIDAGTLAGIGELGVPIAGDLREVEADDAVLIDFTFHSVVADNAELAASLGRSLVIGTTGLDAASTARVEACAGQVPIVWAPNMSVGVNLLFAMTQRAASILGTDYDIEIIETHHRHKQDAPSGTALRLAEKAAAGREVNLDDVANYGRKGITGERPAGEIGIHSVRSGDVVGDHVVSFATEGERVELGHKASSRDAFANGALHAARWLEGRDAGLYDMQDVLGL